MIIEFRKLEDNLDLVAQVLSYLIHPEFEVSERLLWEILNSNQAFADEYCDYLNKLTPGLIAEDDFENLPPEPIIPIIQPIENYKNAIIAGVFINNFSTYIDDLITKIEAIITGQSCKIDNHYSKGRLNSL